MLLSTSSFPSLSLPETRFLIETHPSPSFLRLVLAASNTPSKICSTPLPSRRLVILRVFLFKPWFVSRLLSSLRHLSFQAHPPFVFAQACWNGIAVLDARPFLEVGKGIPKRRKPSSSSPASNGALVNPGAVQGEAEDDEEREGVPPVRFRKSREGECSQSECFLICVSRSRLVSFLFFSPRRRGRKEAPLTSFSFFSIRSFASLQRDFWRWGLGKVQIVPSVRVGYVRQMADWLATERMEIGIRRDSKGMVLRDGKERRIDWVKE